MQANLRPPWSYQRPSWLGSAPVTEWDLAWEAIAESPTRVSYTWMVGGSDVGICCCANENLCYGGRFSGVVRYNRPDWHAHYIGAHTPVPVQLAAHLDKETWAAFAADVEKETATVPPLCRYLIFSCVYDTCCYQTDFGRSDMAVPACQRVVERHAPALHARGVSLTYFDKGRHIFGDSPYPWHLVGFFLDVAAPQSVLAQIQVRVPPGAAPGSTMQVPYNGTMIQCIVPPGAVPGSTFAVQVSTQVPTLAPPAPSTFSVIVPPGLGPGMMIGATVPTTGAQIQIALPPRAKAGDMIQVPIPGGAGAPMAMAAPAAGEMAERI